MKLLIPLNLLLFAGIIEATKMTPEAMPNLANFFATKNLKDIENKINNTFLFSEKETIGSQNAFEEASYNIAFKNKTLTLDEKNKIFKLLTEKAKGKSEDIMKWVRIGATYVGHEKANLKYPNEEGAKFREKLGITAEDDGLDLAISFNSLPAVKSFLKHGADVNKTNALYSALGRDDLSIAKYLLENGANPEGSKNARYYFGPGDPIKNPESDKYYIHYAPIASLAGANPQGTIEEKPIKLLLDHGLNINKIGYYKLTEDNPEKQGTLLDLFYDMYDLGKKVNPREGLTQKDINESLVKVQKSIAMLKKYRAKRMAELKK